MNDTYKSMSEMLDNWLSGSSKDMKMARIEKDILLEKLRNLYVMVSDMATEEYAAPQAPVEPQKAEKEPEPEKHYTPAKTLEEDVDLFLDPEHESYQQVEEELQKLAEEIEEAQPAPTKEPVPAAKPKQENVDIFKEFLV